MIIANTIKKTYTVGDITVQALRGVSCTIEKGEFTSIVGPSGSGKTTFLNLIGCLDLPDEGSIKVEGTDVSHYSQKALSVLRRDKIGFIFQSYNLIPVLTAYENVAFSLTLQKRPEKEVRAKTYEILEKVGLKGMEHRIPSKLSGGQRQRVAIARALVKSPAMVLADEPTANLDSETGVAIIKLMRALNQELNTTFVILTHDPQMMEHTRRIIHLRDGQIESESS